MSGKKRRALALFSGGLDSILAVKVIQSQSIYIEGINFISPFFESITAEKFAKFIEIKLHILDISKEILKIIKKPEYGFGKNLNPCIDCHLLMVKKGCGLMKESGFDFLISGEVLGERPKSQNRNALGIIEKRSGCEGLLLRPLSARRLEETVPEREGWVNRELLYGFSGKMRKDQIKLAGEFGIKDYPTPAGGCLLTVPNFSDRLRERLQNIELTVSGIEILKYGRHFVTWEKNKIVIGRDETENKELLKLIEAGDYVFRVYDEKGPITVLKGEVNNDEILIAASLTARYSQHRTDIKVEILYYRKGYFGDRVLKVQPKNYGEFDGLKFFT